MHREAAPVEFEVRPAALLRDREEPTVVLRTSSWQWLPRCSRFRDRGFAAMPDGSVGIGRSPNGSRHKTRRRCALPIESGSGSGASLPIVCAPNNRPEWERLLLALLVNPKQPEVVRKGGLYSRLYSSIYNIRQQKSDHLS